MEAGKNHTSLISKDQQLLDLLISSDMTIAPTKLKGGRTQSLGDSDRANITFSYHDIAEFTIRTSFRQFLVDVRQFEYKLFFIHFDIIDNDADAVIEEITFAPHAVKKSIIKDDKGIPAVELVIPVPAIVHEKKRKYNFTQMVLAVKLLIDPQNYYPYSYNGEDRYMAVKERLTVSNIEEVNNMGGLLFKPTVRSVRKGEFYRRNVKVDTLKNILEWGKTWELHF